jgi:importin-5
VYTSLCVCTLVIESSGCVGVFHFFLIPCQPHFTSCKIYIFLQAVIDLSLHSLTLVDDDPAWASKSDDFARYAGDESEDDDETASAGAAALDRIAKAMGGKVVWPVFKECVKQYASSSQWQHRRAAVLAMSLVVEGCKRVLLPQIRQLITDVSHFIADPHLRVRHMAFRTLGQIILDFTDPDAIETVGGTGSDPYSAVTGKEGESE